MQSTNREERVPTTQQLAYLSKINFEKRAVYLGGAIIFGFILTLLFKSNFVSPSERERDLTLHWAPSISNLHILCLGIFLLSGLAWTKLVATKQPPVQSLEFISRQEYQVQAQRVTREHVDKLRASPEYRKHTARRNRLDCDVDAIVDQVGLD